jgi:hypothetical protein
MNIGSKAYTIALMVILKPMIVFYCIYVLLDVNDGKPVGHGTLRYYNGNSQLAFVVMSHLKNNVGKNEQRCGNTICVESTLHDT